jgi:hypothetical protein
MAKDRRVSLRVPDRLLSGVYANQLLIRHTREEFVLDFVNRFPPQSSVVARIVVSPGHLRRIIHALDDNLKRFESNHGPMEADTPQSNVARQMASATGSPASPAPTESPAAPAAPTASAPTEPATEGAPKQGQQRPNVARVSEETAAGVYANQMVVTHSGEEFMLDFAAVFPPDSIVTARVFVSPRLFKRMIGALKDNLVKYEAALRQAIKPNVPPSSDSYIN